MVNNLTAGPIQVLRADVASINLAFLQILERLDEDEGLRGRVEVWDRQRVDDPTERSDSLAQGGPVIATTITGDTLTLSETLLLPDGTAAAPSLAFTDDRTLGLFRIGADNLGLSTDGTLRVDLNTTRLALAAGYDLHAGANVVIGAIADKLNAAHLALASQAVGDLLVASAATTYARLALGAANALAGVDSGAGTLEYKVLSGTANRVTVTHGAGTITLSGPQDLAVGNSPTFASLTLSVATGTAPLTIASTTLNANLNADLLDGEEGDFYQRYALLVS